MTNDGNMSLIGQHLHSGSFMVPLAFQKADRFQVLNTHGYDKVGDTHAIKNYKAIISIIFTSVMFVPGNKGTNIQIT